MSKPDERRLHSWKEIAAYFGYDQRTVKRWEQTRGLPVRRLPGARSGVYAHVSDLEAWQRGGPAGVVQGEGLPEVPYISSGPSLPSQEEHTSSEHLERPERQERTTISAPESNAGIHERALNFSEEVLPTIAPAAQAAHNRPRAAWVALLMLLLSAAGATVWLHRSAASMRPPIVQHTPPNQARELYLDGRFRWDKRTPDDLRVARADFEQAIRLDPQYAAAYAGLADCYALQPQFAGLHGEAVFPRMLDAATHALSLDGSLAEGHRALAFALYYWKWDRQGAREEFQRAIALDPRDPTTHLWFANTLTSDGVFDEALHEVDLAREIDPASVPIRADRGWILYFAGKRAEGMAIWNGIERTDPGYRMAHLWSAMAALDQHLTAQYITELRLLVNSSGSAEDRERLALAEQGLRDGGEAGMLGAVADLDIHLYRQHRTAAYIVAESLARTSRTDEALGYLERAFAERNDAVVSLNMPASFPSLQRYERFRQLAARVRRPYAEGPA